MARRETHWLALQCGAIKMFSDLLWRALSRTAVAAANALGSESRHAQLVDMMSSLEGSYPSRLTMIVTHNRLRDGSLKNVTCAWETNKAKLNMWRGKSRYFS